jgi:plasmid stabilization system protein ParE
VAEFEIRLHPQAAAEAETSRAWYFERNASVAAAFLDELSAAMLAIRESPSRWPQVYGTYRRFVLHKFPFSVVYAVRDGFIEVIAIAHHRRKPGYWSAR